MPFHFLSHEFEFNFLSRLNLKQLRGIKPTISNISKILKNHELRCFIYAIIVEYTRT